MKTLFVFFCLCILFVPAILAQNQCKPPEIVFNRSAYNIFDETQEAYLGEIAAETFEKNYRVINNAEANRYVRELGAKLVKHLPASNVNYQFFVVDAPEVNAITLPGGRIYVTKKLIAFVQNEDELAGVIGHELGHAIVRHGAIDMSRYFKQILGVEKVGDRDDIYEKFNRLIEKQNTKRIKSGESHEGGEQLEADRIGLFAMVAAGYDPKAFTSAWERLTETKGKTGSALSDLFGATKPEEKRLREMQRAISTLPAECLEKKTAANGESFEKWRSFVVTTATFQREEKLKSLIYKRALKPSVRGDVKHLQFSPDGNYILAQDAAGISILRREPFKVLYRINAENAKHAAFTPDSKKIVFQTYDLRVEQWSVEDRKPLAAREVYVRGGCWQSALSPDGNFLVCYSKYGNLEIVNVEANESVLKKEKFYQPTESEYYDWVYYLSDKGEQEINAFQMEFSPDGKYFLTGRVYKYLAVGTSSESFVASQTYQSYLLEEKRGAFLAFDLQEKKEIKIGDDLKNVAAMPFAFYSNDKIVGQHRKDADKSGVFSFPAGERIDKFLLRADSYEKPFQGEYVIVRPTTNNPVGVYDLQTKKFIVANKTNAFDGYGDYFVSEGRDGVIDLLKIDKESGKLTNVGNVPLPKNDLSEISAVTLSPDFDWLALSEKARGGIWDLKTGELKIYIRGFSGAVFDAQTNVYADFPPLEKEPRKMALLNPVTGNAGNLSVIATRNTKQHGKFLVRFKTKTDEKNEKIAQDKKNSEAVDGRGTIVTGFLTYPFGIVNQNVYFEPGTLEFYDSMTKKLAWSKAFENGVQEYDVDAANETVSLYWNLTTKAGKNEIKNNPALLQKLKNLGEREGDYLVEVLDANTGKTIGETLIETGEGSFRIARVFAAGDWLTIIDSENRVLLYSLSSGELRHRFFGNNAAVSPANSLAVIQNIAGQLSIYNLKDGRKIDELLFPSAVAYATFSRDGKKLFVLTANQNYYLFDAEGFAVPRAAAMTSD